MSVPASCPSQGGERKSTTPAVGWNRVTEERPPTILLVDDEPYVRDALSIGLTRSISGSRILTAADGPQGLEILRRERVDVVISDNKMPGMDGVEFLIEARRLSPQATRIMITAHPEEKLLERNINEARVRYFFTKPYSLLEVARTVQQALAYQREQVRKAVTLAEAIEQTRGAAQ